MSLQLSLTCFVDSGDDGLRERGIHCAGELNEVCIGGGDGVRPQVAPDEAKRQAIQNGHRSAATAWLNQREQTTVHREVLIFPYDAPDDDIGDGGDIFYFVNAQLLFGSRSHYAQLLGMRLQERGFNGIKYPSFFSDVRPERARFANIAIVGRPIREGLVEIQSLNNLRLDTIRYVFTFGPVTQTPADQV